MPVNVEAKMKSNGMKNNLEMFSTSELETPTDIFQIQSNNGLQNSPKGIPSEAYKNYLGSKRIDESIKKCSKKKSSDKPPYRNRQSKKGADFKIMHEDDQCYATQETKVDEDNFSQRASKYNASKREKNNEIKEDFCDDNIKTIEQYDHQMLIDTESECQSLDGLTIKMNSSFILENFKNNNRPVQDLESHKRTDFNFIIRLPFKTQNVSILSHPASKDDVSEDIIPEYGFDKAITIEDIRELDFLTKSNGTEKCIPEIKSTDNSINMFEYIQTSEPIEEITLEEKIDKTLQQRKKATGNANLNNNVVKTQIEQCDNSIITLNPKKMRFPLRNYSNSLLHKSSNLNEIVLQCQEVTSCLKKGKPTGILKSNNKKVTSKSLKNLSPSLRKSGKPQDKIIVMNDFKSYDSLLIKNSNIHGLGVFTPVAISANTLIMEYKGEVIGKCVSDKREKLYKMNNLNSIYMFAVSEDRIIDATLMGNKARYVNHSCNPNCEAVLSQIDKAIKYCSIRDIEPNEELLIDYNMAFDSSSDACNCQDNNCKYKKLPNIA